MIYRLFTKPGAPTKSIDGVNISSEIVWVETNKKLDIDALYKDGIYVKEVEELPERDIDGNKIKTVNFKSEKSRIRLKKVKKGKK